ncbi:MAG TPA: hypothetical protein VHJ18_30205 [Streptosporangiaceae bacterium]|nr:hypothetical protein [Streptosporangiaceae bacterium]
MAVSSGPSVGGCAKALEQACHRQQATGQEPTADDVAACRGLDRAQLRKAVGIYMDDVLGGVDLGG